MVTHDQAIAGQADRIVRLAAGRIGNNVGRSGPIDGGTQRCIPAAIRGRKPCIPNRYSTTHP